MTEADLLNCTTHETAHLNGGKEWFGYIHRCNEHPRLTRMDKYIRKNRAVESTWRVDGKPVAGLAEAAVLLSKPYQPSADELKLLAEVADEYTLFEGRARFLPLREVGLIEFNDGKWRWRRRPRRDVGRKGSGVMRLNISYCANNLAAALHHSLKNERVTKIGIDEVRAAAVGYLAARPHMISDYDFERLVETSLRKVVERV